MMAFYFPATVMCDEGGCGVCIDTYIAFEGSYTGGRPKVLSGVNYYGNSDSIPDGKLKGWSVETSPYEGRTIHHFYCSQHNRKAAKSKHTSSAVVSSGSGSSTFRERGLADGKAGTPHVASDGIVLGGKTWTDEADYRSGYQEGTKERNK